MFLFFPIFSPQRSILFCEGYERFPAHEKFTMKFDRKTLALLIASLCGTCAVSQGQEDATLVSLAESKSGRPVAPLMVQPAASDIALTSAVGSLSDQDTSSDLGSLSDQSSSDPFDHEASIVPGTLAGYRLEDATAHVNNYNAEACSPCGTGNARVVDAGCGSNLGWLDFDTLLWWGRGLTNSPVIVGGATPSTTPPTSPLLGGANLPIGNDLLFGLRADVGFWLDDCQNYGLGGRAWGILSNNQEQIITNGGNSTGIQFYDAANFGQTNYYLVNRSTVNGANTGTIGVLNELDVFSGDLYLRSRLIGDRTNRTDLLTGYTFLRLDSGYRLQSIVLNGITGDPIPNGTVTTVTDQFTTYNTFHGGHIGLANTMNRGRFGFGLSGKVALGNMESTSIVSGTNVVQPPNLPAVTQNVGLFALQSNQGTISQNNFTFIPEMNAKLRYRIGRANLGVGYTLVVLPEVAMAPSQIDNYLDLPSASNKVSPYPKFNTEAYFLHGLDLGLTFNF
jgi:hypothetical protein